MKFVLVCEGPFDPEDLQLLVRKQLAASVAWMNGDVGECPHGTFPWCNERGALEAPSFVKWSDVDAIAEQNEVPRPMGAGLGGHVRSTLLVLRMLEALYESDSDDVAFILVHDGDGLPEVREEIERGRDLWKRQRGDEDPESRRSARRVAVVGVPAPEHEAWVLSAFEPKGEREKAALAAARTRLGFQPHVESHKLTARKQEDKKDSKRVLDELVDAERRSRLIEEAALEHLRERGAQNGLAAFLDEVAERLAPLLDPSLRR